MKDQNLLSSRIPFKSQDEKSTKDLHLTCYSDRGTQLQSV